MVDVKEFNSFLKQKAFSFIVSALIHHKIVTAREKAGSNKTITQSYVIIDWDII